MYIFYAIVVAAVLASLAASREKTLEGLVRAVRKLAGMTPQFLVMIIAISLIMTILPKDAILSALGGENLGTGVLLSTIAGAIAFIPGFIVFPLCGTLRNQGVSYTVIAAFTTTLMMVGVVSFPLERKYLGLRLAVIRNCIAFGIALVTAVAIGIVFGEIPA
jgi:uncharacterized membrane protein YraQ (UPF0718 family)